ncbi:fibronectin type III domain-containing protein [Rathayibacter sp. AY2B3]|uniref:fibronectin type III domain-containing protein n=1 Tax=Rathayibacter sp. AY2B3 TaxID=2080569 RepID=UPI0015E2C2C3|nr:fibronectin type III domain-containing protein [Rathayibacter sp. AY2B3]
MTATDVACTTPVTLRWKAPAQAVQGFRVHIYRTVYVESEDNPYSYDETVALYSVSGSTSLTADLPFDRYHFDVSSVSDFKAPFAGGSDGEPLQMSSGQSAPATMDFVHLQNVPAPGELKSQIDIDGGSATFSWSAPDAGSASCAFETYVWDLKTLYEGGTGTVWDQPTSSPAITSAIVPIERNMRYEYCVRPGNSSQYDYEGEVYWDHLAETCSRFSTGSAAPDAAQYFEITEATGGNVTVMWRAPERDGGSPITGYRIGRDGSDASGGGPWSTLVSPDKRSQTFTNLKPNTTYTFTLQAVNAKGSGARATTSIVSQPFFQPSEPTKVIAIPDSATRSAVLQWSPPSDTGGTSISGYRVSRDGVDASGSGAWSTIVSSTKRSQSFTNLAPNGSYTLSVSAINVAGESWIVSRSVVLGGDTLSSSVPLISGSAAVGSLVTAVTGTWGPAPVDLAFQWRSNGVDIVGATGSSYVPSASDAGKTLTVAVTGSKSGYVSSTRTSSATSPIAKGVLAAATPSISGSPKVGSTLTASAGQWTPEGVAFTYQWTADGAAVAGATATTFTPTSSTLGKKIAVSVSGAAPGYSPATRTSAPTQAVVSGTFSATTPTISGTARVGSLLTASAGSWGTSAAKFAFQWKANGSVIAGATTATYAPSSVVLGKTITVTVTGSASGYTTTSRTSVSTAAVSAGVLTGPTPKISGTAKIGTTLTAISGTWGPSPVSLTYQWKANGAAITGATGATLKLSSATAGKAITVVVTGKKAGFTTATRTSAAIGPVVK